ncbi:kininogen-1 [Stegostoma tigrinum]|uniref:kininogen-1 n=1 Tax=Stegostoma tigrinum TaxID=3053191 RepID=UPI00286FDF41|nr:kininogen-1 [Stegostoma tigrinum]
MKLLCITIFTIQLLYVDAESEPISERVINVPPPQYPIDCNNPEVLIAVDFTLRKFNAEQKSGHQYALDKVLQAEARRLHGIRYFINFSIHETDCPVGSDKIWKECNYKTHGIATIGHCESNVYIHKDNGIMDVTEFNCTQYSDLHTPIVPQHALCVGCPIDLPTNHSRLNETIALAIAQYNTENNYTNYFRHAEVFKFTSQVVAGIVYGLEFSIKETECSKEDFIDIPPDCDAKADGVKLYCNSKVYIKPWVNYTQVTVNCYDDPPQIAFAAPRYVGWGPLSLFLRHPGQTRPGGQDTHSEEMTSAERALAGSLESPMCPGKPWTALRRIKPTLAPAEEHHENKDPTQTTISDLDLLDFDS